MLITFNVKPFFLKRKNFLAIKNQRKQKKEFSDFPQCFLIDVTKVA